MKNQKKEYKKSTSNSPIRFENHYLRLVLYGLLSAILIVSYGSIERLLLHLEPNLVPIVGGIVTYSSIIIFGFLFLNGLQQTNDASPEPALEYYGLYLAVYYIFILIIVGGTEIFILSPRGIGYTDLGSFGLSRWIIIICFIVSIFLYIKYRRFLNTFHWF